MTSVPSCNKPSIFSRFARDERGNVAMLFALSAIPAVLVAGAAMDYSRATTQKERLQHALDATALWVAGEPQTTPVVQLQQKAQKIFAASFQPVATASTPTVWVSRTGSRVVLTTTMPVDTMFMRLAGVDHVDLRARSEADTSRPKLEIALALDNTGSMAQAGKMPALKAAVNELITNLKNRRINADDVKMSVVPFNTEVKVDTAHVNANWLRWDVTLENGNFGTGRLPPQQWNWGGCISDRDQPHDTTATAPTDHFRRYPASKCHFAGLVQMAPLTTDLDLVRSRVNAMTPTGNTNVTIGLTTGLATLRSDSPFGAASSNQPGVRKILILLTDGDNTMNRWSSNQGDIDARLSSACAQARGGAVQVFTIRVIQGNASLLRSCASQPSMYYDVNNASQLQQVFRDILDKIDNIRIVS